MKRKLLNILLTIFVILMLAYGCYGAWGITYFLLDRVLPIQESYAEWTSCIEEMTLGEEIIVVDADHSKTVGINGGSGNKRTFSYCMIIKSSMDESQLQKQFETLLAEINTPDK